MENFNAHQGLFLIENQSSYNHRDHVRKDSCEKYCVQQIFLQLKISLTIKQYSFLVRSCRVETEALGKKDKFVIAFMID